MGQKPSRPSRPQSNLAPGPFGYSGIGCANYDVTFIFGVGYLDALEAGRGVGMGWEGSEGGYGRGKGGGGARKGGGRGVCMLPRVFSPSIYFFLASESTHSLILIIIIRTIIIMVMIIAIIITKS